MVKKHSMNVIGGNDGPGPAVGNKAENLFLLQESKYPVPAFFCISSEVLDQFLSKQNLQIVSVLEGIDFKSIQSIKSASKLVAGIIADIKLDQKLLGQIQKQTSIIGGDYSFAVRSSATIEDSPSASFAGQFESYLGVSRNEVPKQIVKCWQSLYSPSVLEYCHQNNLPLENLKMGVIVQKMVSADMTGIAFSANPQGLLNEIVVTISNRTNEDIHQDNLPSTTYYYNTTDSIYFFEKQADSPELTQEILTKLIEMTKEFASSFGQFVDIEFALENDNIKLLQIRGISTLKDKEPIILDNSNIVESYPGITLPLTESFAKEAYYKTFRGAFVRGIGKGALNDHYENLLQHMVESSSGRMYYRLNSWLTLLKLLPFSGKVVPVWREMLGIQRTQLLGGESRKYSVKLQHRLASYFKTMHMSFFLPRKMKKLDYDFHKTRLFFKETFNPLMSAAEALELYEDIKLRALKDWDLTLSNDIYAFVWTGLLNKVAGKSGLVINQYISGISDIESIKPINGLLELAEIAYKDGLGEELKKLRNDEEAIGFINSNKNPFTKACQNFISDYGDRSVAELKLENSTWRSSPLLLIQEVLKYSSSKKKLVALSNQLGKNPSGVGSSKESQRLPLGKRLPVKIFRNRALVGIRNREISRLNRSRIFGMVRSIFLTVGERLEEQQVIHDAKDIFYLEIPEVIRVVEQGDRTIAEKVAERKNEYRMYHRLPSYSRLIFYEQVFNRNVGNISEVTVGKSSSSLMGVPCSQGVVEGEVVIVNNPNEVKDIEGKILVTQMTDPGWVYLMVSAIGIIVEKGSLLSHTAIISRELKLPAIVGVDKVTNILSTGDKIRMNATNGKIEILSEV